MECSTDYSHLGFFQGFPHELKQHVYFYLGYKDRRALQLTSKFWASLQDEVCLDAKQLFEQYFLREDLIEKAKGTLTKCRRLVSLLTYAPYALSIPYRARDREILSKLFTLAVQINHLGVTKIFLERIFALESGENRRNHLSRALSYACELGNEDIVFELLYQLDLSQETIGSHSLQLPNKSIDQAFYIAAKYGHASLIKRFLSTSQYICLLNVKLAFFNACTNGHIEVLTLILEHDLFLKEDYPEALIEAIENRQDKVVEYLLQYFNHYVWKDFKKLCDILCLAAKQKSKLALRAFVKANIQDQLHIWPRILPFFKQCIKGDDLRAVVSMESNILKNYGIYGVKLAAYLGHFSIVDRLLCQPGLLFNSLDLEFMYADTVNEYIWKKGLSYISNAIIENSYLNTHSFISLKSYRFQEESQLILDLASQTGDLETVQLTCNRLEKDVLQAKLKSLQVACYYNHLHIVCWLLRDSRLYEAKLTQEFWETVVINENVEILDQLLIVFENQKVLKHLSQVICRYGKKKLFDWFIAFQKFSLSPYEALYIAAKYGHLSIVKRLQHLKTFTNVKKLEKALIASVKGRNAYVVKAIITHSKVNPALNHQAVFNLVIEEELNEIAELLLLHSKVKPNSRSFKLILKYGNARLLKACLPYIKKNVQEKLLVLLKHTIDHHQENLFKVLLEDVRIVRDVNLDKLLENIPQDEPYMLKLAFMRFYSPTKQLD